MKVEGVGDRYLQEEWRRSHKRESWGFAWRAILQVAACKLGRVVGQDGNRSSKAAQHGTFVILCPAVPRFACSQDSKPRKVDQRQESYLPLPMQFCGQGLSTTSR